MRLLQSETFLNILIVAPKYFTYHNFDNGFFTIASIHVDVHITFKTQLIAYLVLQINGKI